MAKPLLPLFTAFSILCASTSLQAQAFDASQLSFSGDEKKPSIETNINAAYAAKQAAERALLSEEDARNRIEQEAFARQQHDALLEVQREAQLRKLESLPDSYEPVIEKPLTVDKSAEMPPVTLVEEDKLPASMRFAQENSDIVPKVVAPAPSSTAPRKVSRAVPPKTVPKPKPAEMPVVETPPVEIEEENLFADAPVTGSDSPAPVIIDAEDIANAQPDPAQVSPEEAELEDTLIHQLKASSVAPEPEITAQEDFKPFTEKEHASEPIEERKGLFDIVGGWFNGTDADKGNNQAGKTAPAELSQAEQAAQQAVPDDFVSLRAQQDDLDSLGSTFNVEVPTVITLPTPAPAGDALSVASMFDEGSAPKQQQQQQGAVFHGEAAVELQQPEMKGEVPREVPFADEVYINDEDGVPQSILPKAMPKTADAPVKAPALKLPSTPPASKEKPASMVEKAPSKPLAAEPKAPVVAAPSVPPSMAPKQEQAKAPAPVVPAPGSAPLATSAPKKDAEIAMLPTQDAAPAAAAPAGIMSDKSQFSILYNPGETDFTPDDQKALDGVIARMLSDSAIRLTITGFAGEQDDVSNTARRTSLKRALAVRKYLISQGIDSIRITVQAMGNNTSEAKKDRVDLVVINTKS